jgi:ABC-type transport system involved in multi-copper enzyme maturation permease subunit
MLFKGWEWAALGLAAVLLVFAIWLIRRLGGSILGPLFLYEMVVLARRGQQVRLRILLAIALLIGLFLAYLKEFSAGELATLFSGESVQLPMNRQADFAETFLVAFMVVQLLAVMLISPALAGSAIAEEKERGTLDYLRSTLLSPWEIGMGKFIARLVFLFAIIGTGIPVLGLAMNQGGMDPRIILAGYIITVSTALSMGGWSFYLGVCLDGLREVLLWVYGVVGMLTIFGLCCGCLPGVAVVSPVSAMTYTFVGRWTSDPNEWAFWLNTLLYGVVHTLVGLGFTLRAIFLIRIAPPIRNIAKRRRRKKHDTYYEDDDEENEDEEEAPPPPPPPSPLENKPKRQFAKRRFRVDRVPDSSNPFLWKERYFGGKSSAMESELSTGCGIILLTGGLFAIGIFLFFAAVIELERGQWSGDAVNGPLRALLTGGFLAMGLILGVRMASSVAFERQRQTLDALLTIPVPRWQILWGKLFAGFYLLRYPLLATFLAMIGGLFSAGVHPLGIVLGIIPSLGYLLLMATFGLWMSTRCKTVTRATVYVLLLTMVLWFGPLIFSPLFEILLALSLGQEINYNMTFATLSTPVTLWKGYFSWNNFKDSFSIDSQYTWLSWGGVLVMGLGYFGMAIISWLAAWRHFENEGK